MASYMLNAPTAEFKYNLLNVVYRNFSYTGLDGFDTCNILGYDSFSNFTAGEPFKHKFWMDEIADKSYLQSLSNYDDFVKTYVNNTPITIFDKSPSHALLNDSNRLYRF